MPFGITIQAILFLITFLLTLITGPIIIPALTRIKFGQTVRDDGPQTHLKKTGTPTIGAFIFLIPIGLITAYLYLTGLYTDVLPLALTTLGFGAVGFLDDYIKVIRKRKDGLYGRQKMVLLFIIASAFILYLIYFRRMDTDIIVPFYGNTLTYHLPMVAYIPFIIFFLLSITNSVNLTDGVDGLAAGVTLIVMVFFTVVAMSRSEWEYIKVFSAMVAGGCLGFLVFNTHPAKVFMGDTGSLALGGAVGAIAVMMKMPLFVIIVGAVYLIEALSVIIQVASFKLTGRRVFKMAPIHHHFELLGWKETKVAAVFYLITFILCILGMLAFK